MKWDALKCNDDEDILEYATHFKKIYKKVDPYKSIPSKTIVRKIINSLSLNYMKFLTIIGSANLDETIKAALNVEVS